MGKIKYTFTANDEQLKALSRSLTERVQDLKKRRGEHWQEDEEIANLQALRDQINESWGITHKVPVILRRWSAAYIPVKMLQEIANDYFPRLARDLRHDLWPRYWNPKDYESSLTINWEYIFDMPQVYKLHPMGDILKDGVEDWDLPTDVSKVEYTPAQFSELIGLPITAPTWEEANAPDFLESEDK